MRKKSREERWEREGMETENRGKNLVFQIKKDNKAIKMQKRNRINIFKM